MTLRSIILALLVMIPVAGRGQNSGFIVEPFGGMLQGKHVYGLDSRHERIYAAADTAGVFMHDPRLLSPGGWVHLGLQGKRCREIAVSPDDPMTMLVGVDRRTGSEGAAELVYRTTDGGVTWELSQEGMQIGDPAIAIFRKIRYNEADPSRVVMAVQGSLTYHQSSDSGKSWTPIPGLEGFTINDIVWDTTRPGTMFAGGESMIFNPVLLKSTDWGATWRMTLNIPLGGDNAIDAIAIHPDDPNLIVAGTEGYFIRSTDNGESWSITAHPDRYYMYIATWDPLNSSRIFAGGGNHPPHTGGIFISNDRGITWDSITIDGPYNTIQRGVTSVAYPGALIFSAGLYTEEPPDAKSGVFIARPAASSVPGRGREGMWREMDLK